MNQSKYVCIKFSDIPQKLIEEYDLSEAAKMDGCISKSSADVTAYHNLSD